MQPAAEPSVLVINRDFCQSGRAEMACQSARRGVWNSTPQLGGLWVEFSANVAGQKWHANLPKPKILMTRTLPVSTTLIETRHLLQ
jgi:hypothetical protein